MHPAAVRVNRMTYAVYGENKAIWSQLEYIKPDMLYKAAQVHPLLLIMWDSAFWWAEQLSLMAGLGSIKNLFVITSDVREGDKRTHGEQPCLALDVRAKTSRLRYFLTQGVIAVGFTRYSDIYEDGHLHADIGDIVLPEKYFPFVIWNPGDKGKWPSPARMV